MSQTGMNQPGIDQTGPVADLVQVVGRLTAVLEREVAMLRAMKPAELQAVQEDKMALTAAYEARIKALKDEPAALDALAPSLRAELKAALDRLRAALGENERSLRAAKDATGRVLRAIAEELENRRPEAAGYSGKGAQSPGRAPARREPVSIAVNRTV